MLEVLYLVDSVDLMVSVGVPHSEKGLVFPLGQHLKPHWDYSMESC